MSNATPLDADASDPIRMGWMAGSPPPADKLVQVADMGHFQFPKSRWAFASMPQLLPTSRIWRGAGTAHALPRADGQADEIDRIEFLPIGGAAPMSWAQSLKANYTDAIVVLHRGRIVYERYFGVMTPHQLHMAMSVTKSYTGTLATMLVRAGELDESKRVPHYIPELAGSAFADATVRDVMDMRIGVDYSEDYADPKAGIWEHARASGFFPRPAGYQGARTAYEFLRGLRKQGEHGQDFAYKTVCTDVLGWLIRRVTGRRYGEWLSEVIWQPIGAEHDAAMLVDEEGTEFAGGGLNPCLRDMARFGELMRREGTVGSHQVLPQPVVEDIRFGGDADAFRAYGPVTLPGGAYRVMWWVMNNDHGAYAARGIHGQAIYIDPKAEMVIARFGSHPLAANVNFDPTTLPAFHALGQWLMRTSSTC
jgi:hypothetical protein